MLKTPVNLRLRSGCGLSALFLCVLTSQAQEASPDFFKNLTQQLMQGLNQVDLESDVFAQYGLDLSEFETLRIAMVDALDEGSLEALVPLRPYVEQALLAAESIEPLQSAAAWLRQRLDYFQVAEIVVTQPPPAAVPAALALTEADYHMWYDKISQRKPPSRAKQFVPVLKSVFRAEGVPEEMVWLAEVESSFNPSAESPVGARGLYQFMPATAERFGLSTKPVDDRLDPQKSAWAAAKYLSILHRQFGSWELALAAYNAGEGRVGRLLESEGGDCFLDIADKLPSETRMYVPKMRAVVQVREGVDLRTL